MFQQKLSQSSSCYTNLQNNYSALTIPHNLCKRYKNFQRLCRRCLNTYGSQTQPKNHMTNFIGEENCNTSNMNPDKLINPTTDI